MNEWINRVHFGDCLETLRRMPDGIVNTCVTSPPYFGLRDYGHAGQIGLEETPEQFIAKLVEVFREVRRVLRDDGTCWVNMGDSYAGSWGNQGRKEERGTQRPINGGMLTPVHDGRYPDAGSNTGRIRMEGVKPKALKGIAWMLAFALRADGWYLRQDIIWAKPNPMPESVTDRCTKAHEYVFLLSKSPRYYCDMGAIRGPAGPAAVSPLSQHVVRQGGRGRVLGVVHAPSERSGEPDERNKRSVWTVATVPYKGAHFATFPPELIEPCILAGSPAGGVGLDPFFGSGTTGEVAQNLGRHWIGCELNPAYKPLQDERLRQPGLILEAA